jgi:hypothetical protein
MCSLELIAIFAVLWLSATKDNFGYASSVLGLVSGKAFRDTP